MGLSKVTLLNLNVLVDRRSVDPPILTFLVPAYNERDTVLKVVEALRRFPGPTETILIDDGSTDGTRDVLNRLDPAGILILLHEKNAGKGSAIRTGLAHARGQYVAIQDADLEYDPAGYLLLLQEARRDHLPAVFGSRFLIENPALYRRFLWGNKVMTQWINFLHGCHLTDAYTGHKLLERGLFQDLKLESRGFELEAEICSKLARRGIPIREKPIRYAPRKIEEGKKIGWKDAVKGAWCALRLRWVPSPPNE